MRAPEQPERDHHHSRAAPWNECWQMIISERQPGCEQIQRRHDNASHKDNCNQGAITCIHSANHFYIAFCAHAKDATDRHVDNHTDQKKKVPHLDSHKCLSERPSIRRPEATIEGEPPFSNFKVELFVLGSPVSAFPFLLNLFFPSTSSSPFPLFLPKSVIRGSTSPFRFPLSVCPLSVFSFQSFRFLL